MRKSDLLLLLAQLGPATAQTVADHLGSSREGASVALLRTLRQGLTHRYRLGPYLVYSLTERGVRRAQYFAARAVARETPYPAVTCTACRTVWPNGVRGTVHAPCGGTFV